jgi:hypothetical protein
MATENQIGFLDLPAKFQLMIYEKLFNAESMANNPTEEAKHANALLATCNRIFSEALPEFNKFGQAQCQSYVEGMGHD